MSSKEIHKYDLVVIGGGPAGYTLAIKQAKKGRKVAIIENENIGGTCLNKGCIPTKALISSAKFYNKLKKANELGLTFLNIGYDWNKIQERKNNIVLQIRSNLQKILTSYGIKVYNSFAILKGKNVVKITEDYNYKTAHLTNFENDKFDFKNLEIMSDKICIATGSISKIPNFITNDMLMSNLFWTSDEALSANEIPESLLVIGGGVIGLEFSQIFAEFGCKVTIVEIMPQILSGLDSASAKRLVPIFRKNGIEILTESTINKIDIDQSSLEVVVSINGNIKKFKKCLLATGRKPNTEFLKYSDVNIELENGFIKVNSNFQTNIENIYAIGDVITGPMLAHKATYDAILLSKILDGENIKVDYSNIPFCVYTYPEIAWIGYNEDELKRNGVKYKIGRSLYSANGRALALGDIEGQYKVLTDDQGKLLGAVVWGANASDLIIEAIYCKTISKLDQEDILSIVHPHPTLSEIFMEAYESAFGLAIHI